MQNLQHHFAYLPTVHRLGLMLRNFLQCSLWHGGYTLVAAVVTCLSAAVAASPQPPMETLFYTPLERQKIVRSRLSMVEPEAEASLVQLSGVVRRSAGKGTVWVNGQPSPEGAPKTSQIRGMDAVVDGQRLRVGESVDKITGVRSDVVKPGTVTVKRQP